MGGFINIDFCCGCEACRNACPVNAIQMKADKEGFLYPEIDEKKCIDCGICDKVCQLGEKRNTVCNGERFYGAKAKDYETRTGSSSGGVFPLLAKAVLSDGGIVFGASLEDDGVVRHRYITTYDDIDKLRKTKYVQSEIGNSLKEVKEFLEDGKRVLFAGTPCQCRGLQKYLNKDYDNLLIADLICYGVPSPGIWKKYLKYLTLRYGSKPESFSFRDKRNNDHGHTAVCKIKGKEYTWNINYDLFCKRYFRNEIIRPSCHSCIFCTPYRKSDLTMGDFWGIENCNKDFDDAMGTSLVIIHSDKGERAFNGIADSLSYFECSFEEAKQPRLCTPTPASPNRQKEMHRLRRMPFVLWIRKR